MASDAHQFTEQEIMNLVFDSVNNALKTNITIDTVSVTVSESPSATGGVSTYSAQGGTSNPLLTNTVVQAGTAAVHSMYSIDFVNTGVAASYVQIFDSVAASVTLGTTVPKLVKWVPAGGAWEEKFAGAGRIRFDNGIAVAATTTPTGLTAPATGINANINFF